MIEEMLLVLFAVTRRQRMLFSKASAVGYIQNDAHIGGEARGFSAGREKSYSNSMRILS